MEGKVTVRTESHSVFGGVADTIVFVGSGQLEKTEYGWHLHYQAVNERDESATMVSDIKLETTDGRAVLINETEGGYGLLLDPKRTTVLQIREGDGVLNLNVNTKEVTWKLAEKKRGSITLAYTLLVGLRPMSTLTVQVHLTKEE
jgi:uncharacterized beta-barrel protein YwiB (DUF1934 family)